MAKKNAPLRGLHGIDANANRVVNVARPDDTTESLRQDAINLEYFIEKNTTQEFDESRTYPAGFIVNFEDTLYISKWDILDVSTGLGVKPTDIINQPVDETDSNPWSIIRTDRSLVHVNQSTTYYTELSKFYLVNSDNDVSILRLPDASARHMVSGQRVTIIDSGNARNFPITVVPDGSASIDGKTEYKIYTNKDEVRFIWDGANWSIDRRKDLVEHYINSNDTSESNYHELYVNESLAVTAIDDFYVELPPYANIGDIISINSYSHDLIENNDVIVKVNAATSHKINVGKLSLQNTPLDTFKFSAKEHILFKYSNNNLWEIHTKDSDSIEIVTGNATLKNYKHTIINTLNKTNDITLTLPQDMTHGQSLNLSNVYQNENCNIKLQCLANGPRINNFKGDVNNIIFKKYSDIDITGEFSSISFDGSIGCNIELAYIVEADGNAYFYIQNPLKKTI